MTETELFNLVQAWVKGVTRLPKVIRAFPTTPRPEGSYGTLNLIRAERINWPDDIEYRDVPNPAPTAEPCEQVPVEEWEWVWSFNVFAKGATIDFAARLVSAAQSSAALLSLHPLTLNRASTIRRIPEQINGVWEDRCQLDLFIRGVVRHAFPVDIIEEASAEFEDHDGTSFGTAKASIITP